MSDGSDEGSLSDSPKVYDNALWSKLDDKHLPLRICHEERGLRGKNGRVCVDQGSMEAKSTILSQTALMTVILTRVKEARSRVASLG